VYVFVAEGAVLILEALLDGTVGLLAGVVLGVVDGDVGLGLELLEGEVEEETLLLELGADGDTLAELGEALDEFIVLEAWVELPRAEEVIVEACVVLLAGVVESGIVVVLKEDIPFED
jgi:hypothetical protein